MKRRGSEAVLGKMPYHLGATVELGVDALDGVGRRDWARVVKGKIDVGEHVGLGSAELGCHPWESGSSTLSACPTASRAVSRVGCRKIDFTTASTTGACNLAPR